MWRKFSYFPNFSFVLALARVSRSYFLDFVKMMTKVEDGLDDVEIVDELHYPFFSSLNGTILYSSNISCNGQYTMKDKEFEIQ